MRRFRPPLTPRGASSKRSSRKRKVDLFSLDASTPPLPDERDLVKFCKLAEELGAGVQLRIPHPRLAFMTGRFADLGVLRSWCP